MNLASWPAKEAAALTCHVYRSDKPIVTKAAKAFPLLSRRERRQLVKDIAHGRITLEEALAKHGGRK